LRGSVPAAIPCNSSRPLMRARTSGGVTPGGASLASAAAPSSSQRCNVACLSMRAPSGEDGYCLSANGDQLAALGPDLRGGLAVAVGGMIDIGAIEQPVLAAHGRQRLNEVYAPGQRTGRRALLHHREYRGRPSV